VRQGCSVAQSTQAPKVAQALLNFQAQLPARVPAATNHSVQTPQVPYTAPSRQASEFRAAAESGGAASGHGAMFRPSMGVGAWGAGGGVKRGMANSKGQAKLSSFLHVSRPTREDFKPPRPASMMIMVRNTKAKSNAVCVCC